jgi:hypothetical protein
MKAIIHWKIKGNTGHGDPVDAEMAAVWVKKMNKKYGAGTHWVIGEVKHCEREETNGSR